MNVTQLNLGSKACETPLKFLDDETSCIMYESFKNTDLPEKENTKFLTVKLLYQVQIFQKH